MKKEQEAYLKGVQGRFKYYCYHTHNRGSSELKWIPSKFHKYLCDTVQEFLERENGKSYEILVINTPPQHGKSITITETLPSWYYMRNPDKNVMLISYGDSLAERFGKRNLDKIREFGEIFGVEVDKKKGTPKEMSLEGHDSMLISRGIGSPLTGFSGDLIVIDDPVKNRQEADSQVYRDKIWNEFNDSVVTRAQAGTKIILIMTRWHEDDLAGKIMENLGDRTTVVNLPCEAEENDLLGREVGEALCPEIGKGQEWLEDFKKSYITETGTRSWNALFQGRPTAREGNLLKKEWWKFYGKDCEIETLPKMQQVIMSVDAAFKDSQTHDYVSIGVWGRHENKIFLIDLVNEHLNFTATIRKIRVLKARYPEITTILIEDRANGTAIIEILKREIMGVIPISPDVSKEARVEAVSMYIEAGNVYLPKEKQFTWEFVEQCASFPNGKHDDMVDEMSQALTRLTRDTTMRRLRRKMERGHEYFHIRQPKKRGQGEKINVI